jgi:hypothetical protein
MTLLTTGYKNVLLFKETVTHLYWLCEIKSYLCYICRQIFDVRAGCLEWQGVDCVRRVSINWIQHPNYNLPNNDIALLGVCPAFPTNGEYPSPVSLMLLCAVRPHVIAVQHCGFCTS